MSSSTSCAAFFFVDLSIVFLALAGFSFCDTVCLALFCSLRVDSFLPLSIRFLLRFSFSSSFCFSSFFFSRSCFLFSFASASCCFCNYFSSSCARCEALVRILPGFTCESFGAGMEGRNLLRNDCSHLDARGDTLEDV